MLYIFSRKKNSKMQDIISEKEKGFLIRYIIKKIFKWAIISIITVYLFICLPIALRLYISAYHPLLLTLINSKKQFHRYPLLMYLDLWLEGCIMLLIPAICLAVIVGLIGCIFVVLWKQIKQGRKIYKKIEQQEELKQK